MSAGPGSADQTLVAAEKIVAILTRARIGSALMLRESGGEYLPTSAHGGRLLDVLRDRTGAPRHSTTSASSRLRPSRREGIAVASTTLERNEA